MTITEFLLARIAEDEKVATEAKRGGDGQWWVEGEHPLEECIVEGDHFKIYDEGGHDAWQAEHIARHDPARVLAECAAKRAIVEAWVRTASYRDYEKFEAEYNDGLEFALECLAAVYKDHPDYRQEWAVLK